MLADESKSVTLKLDNFQNKLVIINDVTIIEIDIEWQCWSPTLYGSQIYLTNKNRNLIICKELNQNRWNF